MFHNGDDSSEFLLGLLLVFFRLARPSLVLVAAIIIVRAGTILGVMGPVGSMHLAVVRRLPSFLAVVIVGLGLLLLLLGFRLDRRWFNTLDVLHEVHDFNEGMFHWIKALLFHLVLPRARRSKECDVKDFVLGQLLIDLEWRQIGQPFVVQTNEILEVLSGLHLNRLLHVPTH